MSLLKRCRQEYQKKYRDSHREQIKKYRETHKEQIREFNKKYREKHKEQIREYDRKYREAHKEQHRECMKKYYEANKEKYLQYLLKEMKVKQKRVELLGGKCQLCGYNKCIASLEFHHVDPTQKEGNKDAMKKVFDLTKFMLLCSNCHREIHYAKNHNELSVNLYEVIK